MRNRKITKEEARAELARRELARRQANTQSLSDQSLESTVNDSQGFSGIGSDLVNSLSNLPADIVSLLSELPGQAKASFNQIKSDPKRALLNLGAGVGEGLIGAANIPSNIAQYLSSKGIVDQKSADNVLRVPDLGIEKLLRLDQPQEGDALLRGIGSFTPYSRVGRLSEGAKGLAKRSAATSAWAAGQNQDPLQAAIIGYLTEKAAKSIANTPNLAPSKFLRGNLTPEELQANLRATAGTETGLGDVLENPNLKRFLENKAQMAPYSGATEPMQRTAKEINVRSNNILDSLLQGERPENIGQDMLSALKEAEIGVTRTKNQKWKKVNDIAEKNDVTTNRSNLRDTAKGILSEILSDPDLAIFRDNQEISQLKKIAEGNDKSNFSLRESDLLRGELNNAYHEANVKGERTKAKLYKDLKEAVEKDIQAAIDGSKVDSLKNARDEAMKYHREQFSKFDDPDIQRFTRRGADSDTLAQFFLRTGRLSDRANLIEKLQEHLPQDKKGYLPYAYFSNALENGQVNPNKLRTLYKNLGEKQKEALFPDALQRQAFDDHINLVSKNQEALSNMFNPKTGFRVGNYMQHAMDAVAAALGGAAGGLPYAILGGAASHILPGLAMRPAVKLLTNPQFREAIVKKMIEREPRRDIAKEQLIDSLINKGAKDARTLTLPVDMYINAPSQQGIE